MKEKKQWVCKKTIIQELGVKPVIDAQEEIRRSIDFLKDIRKTSFLKPLQLGIGDKTQPWQDVWRN